MRPRKGECKKKNKGKVIPAALKHVVGTIPERFSGEFLTVGRYTNVCLYLYLCYSSQNCWMWEEVQQNKYRLISLRSRLSVKQLPSHVYFTVKTIVWKPLPFVKFWIALNRREATSQEVPCKANASRWISVIGIGYRAVINSAVLNIASAL